MRRKQIGWGTRGWGASTKTKIYGVSWGKVASPVLSRTDKAVGMVAAVGGQNDFNAAEIFKDIKEVVDLFNNKFVRIPKFWIKKGDGVNSKTWQISKREFAGAYLPWCFWDFNNNWPLPYIDIGKHVASLSDDGLRLESKVGKYPLVGRTIVQFRDLARANGAGYQQFDIHAVDVLQALFYVWGANLNSQALMQGYTTGQYSASHTATASGTAVNQVVLANANADQYRVGQAISIGASLGSNSVFYGRTITAINVVDGSNKALVFDGAPVNIAIGNVVYNTGYKTGWSTELQTGWAVANDGKSPMAFYGIESLYGDVWQWVDGLNINEGQGWVCKNAAQYASNLFAAPYEQLSYMTALVEGHATAMGHDPNRPFAAVTSAVGGSSTTFYSDYYFRAAGQRVAMLGGRWNSGSFAGLSFWHLNSSSGVANVDFGARLLKKPL
jgi:hypothetical protein